MKMSYNHFLQRKQMYKWKNNSRMPRDKGEITVAEQEEA